MLKGSRGVCNITYIVTLYFSFLFRTFLIKFSGLLPYINQLQPFQSVAW